MTTQPTDEPQVSIEEGMANTLKVTPGDSVTFDISGRKITARVASIRRIDVHNVRTAFVFVFRPGTLEAAPQSFAATVLNHVPQLDRQKLQRDIVDSYPNVQIFDVADIVDAVNKLVKNFVIAISFVGSFVLLSGIMILIGSVALTKITTHLRERHSQNTRCQPTHLSDDPDLRIRCPRLSCRTHRDKLRRHPVLCRDEISARCRMGI